MESNKRNSKNKKSRTTNNKKRLQRKPSFFYLLYLHKKHLKDRRATNLSRCQAKLLFTEELIANAAKNSQGSPTNDAEILHLKENLERKGVDLFMDAIKANSKSSPERQQLKHIDNGDSQNNSPSTDSVDQLLENFLSVFPDPNCIDLPKEFSKK